MFVAQEAVLLDHLQVVLECDSLLFYNTINGLSSNQIAIEPIISDIRTILLPRRWSLVHVRRAGNSLAHKLATWALRVDLSGFIPLHCIPPSSISSCDNPSTPADSGLFVGGYRRTFLCIYREKKNVGPFGICHL